MTPGRLLNRTVTLHTVTVSGSDVYGNPAELVTAVDVVGEVQQASRSDRGDDQHTQDQTWRLFLPAGTALTGWDRVTVDGAEYEVEGPPWPVVNARTGVASHVEATLRRTT